MARTRRSGPPADVRGIQQQFEHWRASKQSGDCVPQALWNGAARLAATHGVHRVAGWLRLNATRLAAHAGRRGRRPRAPQPQTFVEGALPPGLLLSGPSAEYALELEHPATETLRIRVRGATVAEIVALAQALRPSVGAR